MRATRTSGGSGPEGPTDGHSSVGHADNFARAVDAGLRTASDPVLNRELAVAAALRQTGSTLEPNTEERERIRQRIMAEFPSVVHEGNSPVLPLRSGGQPTGRRTTGRRVSGRRVSGRHHAIPDDTRGRLVFAAAAALCLLMSLSGMSLLLSRDALPGDALYAFKRSAESAELGLTFGDERRAHKHLDFAEARVSEIEELADQADAAETWSAGEAKFVRVLDDFEVDLTAATRLLTNATETGRTDGLTSLRGWVEQHQTRLDAIRGALPLSASARLSSTLELLDRVSARIAALSGRAGCASITSGAQDDLGLLPARGACRPTTPNTTSSAAPLPQADNAPGRGRVDGVVPPGLLAPPSGVQDAESGEEPGRLGLPSPEEGLLPGPGESEQGPVQRVPHDEGSPPSVLPPLLSGLGLLPGEGPGGE